MPKLFASEVVIRDHETGKTFPATIEVNKPLIYKGVAVYQSSFEDGGSKLKLTGFPMAGPSTQAVHDRRRSGRLDPALARGLHGRMVGLPPLQRGEHWPPPRTRAPSPRARA